MLNLLHVQSTNHSVKFRGSFVWPRIVLSLYYHQFGRLRMEQIQDLAQEVPCHLETLSADVPWRLDWMKTHCLNASRSRAQGLGCLKNLVEKNYMSTFVSEFFAIVSMTYTPHSGGGFTCHCLKKPTVVLQRFGTFSSPILVGVPPTTERLDKGHSSPEN